MTAGKFKYPFRVRGLLSRTAYKDRLRQSPTPIAYSDRLRRSLTPTAYAADKLPPLQWRHHSPVLLTPPVTPCLRRPLTPCLRRALTPSLRRLLTPTEPIQRRAHGTTSLFIVGVWVMPAGRSHALMLTPWAYAMTLTRWADGLALTRWRRWTTALSGQRVLTPTSFCLTPRSVW